MFTDACQLWNDKHLRHTLLHVACTFIIFVYFFLFSLYVKCNIVAVLLFLDGTFICIDVDVDKNDEIFKSTSTKTTSKKRKSEKRKSPHSHTYQFTGWLKPIHMHILLTNKYVRNVVDKRDELIKRSRLLFEKMTWMCVTYEMIWINCVVTASCFAGSHTTIFFCAIRTGGSVWLLIIDKMCFFDYFFYLFVTLWLFVYERIRYCIVCS